MFKETDTLELKRELTKDFCKEVVAFVNTSGGRILVGVDDDGSVPGIEDCDAVMLAIGNMVQSNVCPEVRPFVHIGAIDLDGSPVVEVTVEEGDRKPYCIAQKGFVPAGVYLRTGSGVSHASQEIIRKMIRESDGDSFETRRSTRQDLSFAKMHEVFAAADLPLADENMRTLQMLGADGYYTNLALLLSDQCGHSIKCAVYEDRAGTRFQSRREFTGSLFKQLEDALGFIDLNNRLLSSFDGIVRHDRREYPVAAIREALVNGIVHRKYDFADSTIINIFCDRIEFVSLGGLAEGVTLEDVMNGVSVKRNPRLADVFYRLNLIESYGMGLRTIRGLYAESNAKPQFKASPESFVAVLPNMDEPDAGVGTEPAGALAGAAASRQGGEDVAHTLSGAGIFAEGGGAKASEGQPVRARDAVLKFASAHGSVSRREAESLLGMGKDSVLRLLDAMVGEGELARFGRGRGTRYELLRAES